MRELEVELRSMEREVTNEKQKYKSLVVSSQKEVLKATERAEKAEKEVSTLKAAAERKANSNKNTKVSLQDTQVDETQRGSKKKRKTVQEDDSEKLPTINYVTNASSLPMDTINPQLLQ